MKRPRRARSELDYRTLADLRYHLRRFLRQREVAARAAGVEPQQYLLLLQLKGLDGRAVASIGTLAERLQIRHHSAVELVDRLEGRGMVTRRRHAGAGRTVVVELTSAGEAVLQRLALNSLAELQSDGPTLLSVLRRLTRGRTRGARNGRGHVTKGDTT